MATTTNPSLSPATTPILLLLSLNKETYWDEQHKSLVDLLSSKATIKRVTKAPAAVKYLTENTPSAIIITDPALTQRDSTFDGVQEKVVAYVRGGGIAVIATHFTTFVLPTNMSHWFNAIWGLRWTTGDYYRTTVHFNPDACGRRFSQAGLSSAYSQKAVHLKNATRDTALYLPSNDSRLESRVFQPEPVDGQQIPVAFARVGTGYLGYIGDVNTETESQTVIVAMCGL